MDKLACRTYGVLWSLYAPLCFVASVSFLIVFIAIANIGDYSAPNLFLAEALLILVPFTSIVVAVGMLAYLRYISAMIVGCVLLLISAIVMSTYIDIHGALFIVHGALPLVGVAEVFLIFVTFAAIVVAVGMLAYFRYVSAMIVGCFFGCFQ